jgi:hypothetical protein
MKEVTPNRLSACTVCSAATICGTSPRTLAMSSPNEPLRSCRNCTSSGAAVVPPPWKWQTSFSISLSVSPLRSM